MGIVDPTVHYVGLTRVLERDKYNGGMRSCLQMQSNTPSVGWAKFEDLNDPIKGAIYQMEGSDRSNQTRRLRYRLGFGPRFGLSETVLGIKYAGGGEND